MKVRELIQDLLLADPELEVLMSSDSEGNRIKPMFGGDPYDVGLWDGDEAFYSITDATEDEIDVALFTKVIVLWPV